MWACSIVGLGAIEQPRMAIVVGEGLGTQPDLRLLDWQLEAAEAALRIFARPAYLARFGQTVGLVVGAALEDLRLHLAVALQVLEGAALGLVDRNLVEVDGAKARELSVLVGEQPALQQRVFREVDAGRNVGRQERDLLGLGEEVVGVAVQHHAPDDPDRNQLLRNDLGGVEDVEGQCVGLASG